MVPVNELLIWTSYLQANRFKFPIDFSPSEMQIDWLTERLSIQDDNGSVVFF